MRGSIRGSLWLLVVLSLTGAACSKEATNTKMSNDDAVSLLEQQGYTEQSAQCLIDGVTKQNVDIFTFLVSDRFPQHDIDVVNNVGSYCIEHYGFTGTLLPGMDAVTTTLASR
jgi:hypothetical protein